MASHRGQGFVGRWDEKPKLATVIGDGETDVTRIAFNAAKQLGLKTGGNVSPGTDTWIADVWGLKDHYPDDGSGLQAMQDNVNVSDVTLIVIPNRHKVHETTECAIRYIIQGLIRGDYQCDHTGKEYWQEIAGVRSAFVAYNFGDITQKAFIKFLEVNKVKTLHIAGDWFETDAAEKRFKAWIWEVFLHSITSAVWIDDKKHFYFVK